MSDASSTDQLLTEIRDLLAGREKQYSDYIANVEKRNAETMNEWMARTRRWVIFQWIGIFAAVYVGVYFAIRHAS